MVIGALPEGAEGVVSLLSGIPLPAFLLDRENRFIAANPLAIELIGVQFLGRNIALAIRRPELFETIAEVRKHGQQLQVVLRQIDDAQYQAVVSPIEWRAGQDFVLCVLRDTTSEAKNEEMRRDFVANVSHELRTPLTAMMGFIETLQGPAKDDAKARERFLGIMENEAGRMNRLVQDLLQLSRVESEERMRPRQTVDLVSVIKRASATLHAALDAKKARLAIDLPEQALNLAGDGDQLMQVFLNLIENAVKYGAKGGEVTVSLSRASSSQGHLVQVAVTDQGDGIAPEHIPRLTERFYRIDGHRSRAEGGTGLGLAIVKHILNRHRGSLKIESRKGQGSTFTVSLPLTGAIDGNGEG